jgi:hypothetical protein
MSLHHLKIASVNVHKQNAHMQAILQNTDADILLIQEPWFGTITTLQSDSDPNGIPQMGGPANNMWDTHILTLNSTSTCKALMYTRHTLKPIVRNNTNHPAASPNTVVLNVDDGKSISLCIINVYHAVPSQGHDLHHITNLELGDLESTLLIGNFNIHSPQWSLPGKMLSSWASRFTDWMDDNSVECLNPLDQPTWTSSHTELNPSIIDLVLANNAACFSGQIGEVDVSFQNSLGLDHAMILIPPYRTKNCSPTPTHRLLC